MRHAEPLMALMALVMIYCAELRPYLNRSERQAGADGAAADAALPAAAAAGGAGAD